MGITKLREFIRSHQDQLCTPAAPIRGKLLVDGCGVLHELYALYKVEWAFGGCYAEQLKATVHFYETLVRAGVEPIVIMEGGGSESFIDYAILRRSNKINNISGNLRKQHENSDGKEYASHHLPVLSWHVYISSLKQLDGVQFYIADGKAHATIVQLANSYGCPVLTSSTNYCVGGVENGVIFIENLEFGPERLKFGNPKLVKNDLKLDICNASIYKQSRLIKLLSLQNPNLVFAIVAIMGDGINSLISSLYHGSIKADIEKVSTALGIKPKDRWCYFNIADYFREHNCQSFEDFKHRIDGFNFVFWQRDKLEENCRTAFEVYNTPKSDLNIEILKTTSTLQCLSSCESFNKHVVKMYREGNFPDLVIDAVGVGKCALNPDIGDADQPPVQQMGRHVRSVMYGLAMPLSTRKRRIIEEYYRSDKPNNTKWDYVPFKVQPLSKYKHLSVDRIFDLDEEDRERREREAEMTICDVLEMPMVTFQEFSGALDNTYLLGILTTHYWAQHLFHSNQLDEPNQLIKALVLNFFFCPEQGNVHQGQQYLQPKWIKVYHALLEWQSLYFDVCGLNEMLLSPFPELPLKNILHGSFVTELALLFGPESIVKYRGMLTQAEQELHDKIVKILVI